MKNDLISVIIPIFNVEQYLKRCIDSVINQTYKNIEIILVDDESPDNCPKICDEYQKNDSRIKVIHKTNGGLSDARNAGLEIATGEYVTFIDSDDYIDCDYIEFLYNLINKYDVKMSICSYKAIYDNGTVLTQENNKEYKISAHDTLEKMLYHEDFNVATWAKLYKKELFNNVRFPKGKIFEDALTTYKLVDQCDNVAIGLTSKYNYMIRSNSILTGKFNIKKLTLVDAYEEMGNYIIKKYPDLESAIIRSRVYANISTLRQIINIKPRMKVEEKKLIKFIRENKKIVLSNERVQKRDKIAIMLISINRTLFKYCWNIYCKKTGRNIL